MGKMKQNSIEELLEEALVPEEEQPYKVPENWVWSKLGGIVTINMGQSPKGEYCSIHYKTDKIIKPGRINHFCKGNIRKSKYF
jgi:type I restriction enzyme S subunit